MRGEVLICEDDFDLAREYKILCEQSSNAGAVVMFVGLVRDLYSHSNSCSDNQEKIDYIELQHYSGMTESLCQKIIDQARVRYQFTSARVIHRVGKLAADEQIVFVGVVSQHRQSAFDASQFIMDYLKTNATIWKKEVGARGEHWLGIKDKDQKAIDRWQ